MNTIHSILKSSRAAIDLASIMVGIIIIGLIGGVIAATVFAVIPWAQDNAAKNQLESIHTAENALYGLSSDSNVTLQGGATKTSFGSSSHLDANNLLSLNKNGEYCVVQTSDGKDYHAYVKSGSGKWLYSLNSKKTPQVLNSGIMPCLTADTATSGQTPGAVNPAVDDGAGAVPTTPGTGNGSGTTNPPTNNTVPVGTVVYSEDFESYAAGSQLKGWSYSQYAYSFQTAIVGGTTNKAVQFKDVARDATFSTPSFNLTPGTYTASFTAYRQTSNKLTLTTKVNGQKGDEVFTDINKHTVLVDFTVSTDTSTQITFSQSSGYSSDTFFVDNIKVTKTGEV